MLALPNLHHLCIIAGSRILYNMGDLDLIYQGHLGYGTEITWLCNDGPYITQVCLWIQYGPQFSSKPHITFRTCYVYENLGYGWYWWRHLHYYVIYRPKCEKLVDPITSLIFDGSWWNLVGLWRRWKSRRSLILVAPPILPKIMKHNVMFAC